MNAIEIAGLKRAILKGCHYNMRHQLVREGSNYQVWRQDNSLSLTPCYPSLAGGEKQRVAI